MTKHENYVADQDDSFDSTFAHWIFSVPEKWQEDYNKLTEGDVKGVSLDYQNKVREIFPKLKEQLDEMWPESKTEVEKEGK